MLIQPILFYPYNFCLNCKSTSIEIYSWHNYPQKYSKVLDQYDLNHTLPDYMDKYGIYTMRCSRCGKEYKIVWEDGIPRPILNNFYTELFMSKFKEDSINGRPDIIENIYEKRMNE